MKMNHSKKLRSLATLFMLFAMTMPSYALDKTEQGVYIIRSGSDYEEFRQLVADGSPYANAVLENDIKVISVIGRGGIECHYRGTFDGQGHTIDMRDVTNSTEEKPWGLFQYTEPGCVIKNLRVTGKIISQTASHIGSLIGCSRGTRIENCISNAEISYRAHGYVGGLVGISYGESFFENCAYTGKIVAPIADECYGFVGKNMHMVSLKSNLVAAKFMVNPTTRTGQFMKAERMNSQTVLNNYACHEVPHDDDEDPAHSLTTGLYTDPKNGFPETVVIRGKNVVSVKDVSLQDVNNGKLCLDLNIRGRNGVVWYQHDEFPYPFKGDGDMAVKNAEGNVVTAVECDINSYDDEHICSNCGAIEPGSKIEPLQVRSEVNDQYEVNIGYLKFKINKDRHLDTAELHRRDNAEVNAAHIPETINVDGEVYRVDFIKDFAFEKSKIEYLYIGKNVNNISDDTFNNCNNLKYVHLADTTITTKFGTNTLATFAVWQELFHESPLEYVYIGRNIKWDPTIMHDAPFEDRDDLKTVIFGPRVTLVGNSNNMEDPRNDTNNGMFENCDGIREMYFLGDDKCLEDNNTLWVTCWEGMRETTKHYISRTFREGTKYDGMVKMNTDHDETIFKGCKDIIYGPYVKKINAGAFRVDDGLLISMPESVDFTKAHNLETIDYAAFQNCDKTYFIGTFENTKLVTIGENAFYDCDQLKNIVIPGTMTKIRGNAFKDLDGISVTFKQGINNLEIGSEAFYCDDDKIGSIYVGRNLVYDKCPFYAKKELGTIVIAPEVGVLPLNMFTGIPKLGALTFTHGDSSLELQGYFDETFSFAEGISSMCINRGINERSVNESVCRWGGATKSSLTELTCGTPVVDDDFSGFTRLRTIMFGENVKTVNPETFKGCTNLKTVFAVGNIDIQHDAFNGCTNLNQVFLMGKDLTLSDCAFAGCNKIDQVMIGLTEDPKKDDGYHSAFSDDAYQNTKLVCAGDREHKKIIFTSEPWASFVNREIPLASKDFEYGFSDEVGDYEHAYLDHNFNKGKYEMVYLPFTMDSYYFGSDAQIYRLDKTENTYNSHSDVVDERYNIVNVHFNEQDVEKTDTLCNGLYIVNTKHDIKTLEAHPNLFRSRTIKVDNSKKTYESDGLPDIVVNEEEKTLGVSDNAFIYQDGVIKHIANNVSTIPNGVTLYRTNPADSKELVFNLVDDNNNVLVSLNTGLGFNEHLEGYTTFYDEDYTYIAPEWCEVYVVTQGNSDGSLVLQKIEDRIINKGQAVLIKSQNGVPGGLIEYIKHTTEETTDPLYTDNILRGVSVDTKANELDEDNGFVYVLSCNSNYSNTGFYKLSGDRIMPAHKAYIPPYLINTESLAKTCLFVFNDNTDTGIGHAVENAGADNTIYDLMGRSLKRAGFKGIYIISGKKVVVK